MDSGSEELDHEFVDEDLFGIQMMSRMKMRMKTSTIYHLIDQFVRFMFQNLGFKLPAITI